MANKSKFVVSQGSIASFFKTSERKVYNEEQLTEILEDKRALWNLPASMSPPRFIAKLVDSKILLQKEVEFTGGLLGMKTRYMVQDATVFHIAASLINKSYFSHYSAVYLQGLTTQVPKTIYLSFEQSKKLNVDRELDQKAIDAAFTRPQRKSLTTAKYNEYTILVHNGMYTNKSGVYTLEGLPVTSLERTLIDIAVRPGYTGGVDTVLDVYRRAADQVSINKLVAILDKLHFIYPYHQAIGFYLDKAGFDQKKLAPLSRKPINFDFYLTYEIADKAYDEKWRIYYPKGM